MNADFFTDHDGFFAGTTFGGAIGMQNLAAPWQDAPAPAVPVTGHHVLSTAPWQKRCPGKPFCMRPYVLLTARLSALAWRRYQGPIHLITDEMGAAYCKETGLAEAYDSIIVCLDQLNYGICQDKFWAAGKLLAWTFLQPPCAVLDMDLIVWKPLDLHGQPLVAAHVEHIDGRVYPPFSHFEMSPRYSFPKEWSPTADALNTSFVYMEDDEFRREYTRRAIEFMQFERDTPDDDVKCMVFAEQRILGMCAAARGMQPRLLVDFDKLLAPQDFLTHIWSSKRLLQSIPELEARCERLCRDKLAAI